MASSAWAWLGFFWASSGLLLLGFFYFFFFWCLVFFFFWRLAVPPASGWRLPFHSFLTFFMGGHLLLGRVDTVPGRRKSPDTSRAVLLPAWG
jgi:hypothetical protein